MKEGISTFWFTDEFVEELVETMHKIHENKYGPYPFHAAFTLIAENLQSMASTFQNQPTHLINFLEQLKTKGVSSTDYTAKVLTPLRELSVKKQSAHLAYFSDSLEKIKEFLKCDTGYVSNIFRREIDVLPVEDKWETFKAVVSKACLTAVDIVIARAQNSLKERKENTEKEKLRLSA